MKGLAKPLQTVEQVIGLLLVGVVIVGGLQSKYWWPWLLQLKLQLTAWVLPLQQQFQPQVTVPGAVLFPVGLTVAYTLFFKVICPRPQVWSRILVSGVLLFLTGRYFVWRITNTLNFDDPLNGSLSLAFMILEGSGLVSSLLTTWFGIFRTDRTLEANRAEVLVQTQDYLPSVDVIIPTYNEPEEILRRTVIGCQALVYPNKTIYLLDDLRRPQIRQLAAELGCAYRDRPDNHHAKAGNVNHALPSLSGELMAVFDADYIPSRNFLQRTVGFFVNPKVAMVQTPQNFFNEDPVTVNLGLEGVVNNEQNFFFRHIQPSRDAFNAVICCGSCFVIRRRALDEIGGIPTESIAEDMFTSIKLQALGYEIKYLNENLSAGMSAENTTAYTNQRLRWGRGTLQSMFCATNVMTLPGLTWGQRLYHGMSILYWVQSVPKLAFLLLPALHAVFGVVPIKMTVVEVGYVFLPFYLANLLTFSWLSCGWRSLLWSEVYETLLCVPTALMVFSTLHKPFGKGFKVTPKGVASAGVKPNWDLIFPLLGLAGLNLLSLGGVLWRVQQLGSISDLIMLGVVWSIYNMVLIGVSMMAAIDVPQRRHPRFDHHFACRLAVEGQLATGATLDLSEAGAQLLLDWPQGPPRIAGTEAQLELFSEALGWVEPVPVQLRWGELRRSSSTGFPQTTVGVEWGTLPLAQYRRCVDFLYCQPGQWPEVKVPEYRTLWAFAMSVFRVYPLTETR